MAKYYYSEKKDKVSTSSYHKSVPQGLVEDIARKMIAKLMIEQKYRDPKYSAKRLSQDIGVNIRHISAVVSLRFQQNYSELVNRMRLYEARYMLQSRSFDDMTIEDIAINVGFTTRQSFYASFYRMYGTTPKEYRLAYGFTPKNELPPAKAKKQKAKRAVTKKKETGKK